MYGFIAPLEINSAGAQGSPRIFASATPPSWSWPFTHDAWLNCNTTGRKRNWPIRAY